MKAPECPEKFDIPLEPSSDESTTPKRKKILWGLSLAITLIFFTQHLTGVVFKNQILYQSCAVVFHYNETNCKLLGTDQAHGNDNLQDIEKQVEPYAANIFMARSLLEAIVPSVISLFLGSWSDKFGRKPVILIVSGGFFISFSSMTILSLLSTCFAVNPWLYIVMLIPGALSGANCTLFATIYSYITDLTTVEERPFHLGIVGASVAVGFASGAVLGGVLFNATNTITVFGISAAVIFISIICTISTLKESLKPEDIDKTSRIRGLFKLDLIVDVFRTCCQKISGSDRIIVWCAILSLGLESFAMHGSGTVFYLFLRKKFTMTVSEFTFYEAANITTIIVGAALGITILQTYFKISPTALTLCSLVSAIIDAIIKAIASKTWHLYLATGFSILKGLMMPMCQAILSNVVSAHDIGKVYSLSAAIESISPLGSVPVYTYIYSSTLDTYPGAFNVVSAAIYLVSIILVTTILVTEIMVNRKLKK